MKVPLIGICSPYTKNVESGALNAIMWRNGAKEVAEAPYEPYCYVPDSETGKQYSLTGQIGSILLRKEHYRAGEELPSSLILDGGRENIMDRLVIEHPDYFNGFPNEKPLKSLCFDIETHSPDGSFPFGENYPVVAIGIVTSTGEREVYLWDGKDDKQVLIDFAKFIKSYDPDVIYGYNLVGYDVPQILYRAAYHGMTNYKKLLNRDGTDYGWSQPKESDDLRMKAGGRVIVDVLKHTRLDYALSGLPRGLKPVSRHFGLEPLELDFEHKDLLDYELSEIHDYVLSDVDCTKFLFDNYFPRLQYTAELIGVPLETYINAPTSYVTKILQGRSLFEQKIVTKDINKDRHPEIYKGPKGNFQAAYINLFEPGFHKKNIKVDFSSFYPSIAMALNLGPDTTKIVGYEDYIDKLEYINGKLYIPDDKIGKRVIIQIETNRQSCLYKMCKQFTEMRKPFKEMGTLEGDSKSNALKIMVNTFYGANTNPYLGYGDMATGITITAIARFLLTTGIQLIQKKYGDKSVVYVHTDGINTNCDIDVEWLTKRLRLIFDATIPNVESKWISLDKDVFKEGLWIQIGNYVLRNMDNSITKHGSTFKASTRSTFYKQTINKLIDARLDNVVTKSFIDELYDFDNLPMETFIQRRTLNRKIEDYKSETDMMIPLVKQGLEVGIEPKIRTSYLYYKTKVGYKIEQLVTSKTDLDVRYYWDIVSRLLDKFGVGHMIKKNPPLTILDRKQKSLLEWV
jgi:DNA polymerase elongation subunit (family B)